MTASCVLVVCVKSLANLASVTLLSAILSVVTLESVILSVVTALEASLVELTEVFANLEVVIAASTILSTITALFAILVSFWAEKLSQKLQKFEKIETQRIALKRLLLWSWFLIWILKPSKLDFD